jgi:F0F1-type ATP synthase membrane subunit c/vacuolar-type H+-ATPase subunit K
LVRTNLKARLSILGAFVLIAGLAGVRPAVAQGFYLGAAASHAAVNATVVDESRNSYKFFLGFELPVFLGVEAAWVNFGKFDGVITSAGGSTRVGYDAKTGTAALTGRIPIGDLATLYAKAGYMYWSTDVTLTGTATDPHFEAGTDHGHDPFFGAGLRLNFGKFSVLGEGERYKLRDVDINAVSVGVRVTL